MIKYDTYKILRARRYWAELSAALPRPPHAGNGLPPPPALPSSDLVPFAPLPPLPPPPSPPAGLSTEEAGGGGGGPAAAAAIAQGGPLGPRLAPLTLLPEAQLRPHPQPHLRSHPQPQRTPAAAHQAHPAAQVRAAHHHFFQTLNLEAHPSPSTTHQTPTY